MLTPLVPNLWWVSLAAVLSVLALPAHAASFDCAKASTKVEHIICDNPDVSKLDEELAASYKAALQDQSKAESIKQSQKQWIRKRNECANASCVKSIYKARLKLIAGREQKLRFSVTKGKGFPICESYARFLNSLPDDEAFPICHLKLSPDFPDLKEPDWEDVDILSHLKLTYSIEKIIDPKGYIRPVDTFDHWKSVFEQQINDGKAAPRLRRTHLALLDGGPVETILAYEPDREACENNIKKYGYSSSLHTSLFLWDEQSQKIQPHISYIAFGGIPEELLLYQGRPYAFFVGWEYPRATISGELDIYHFKKVGAEPYASLSLCQINFGMPHKLYERMAK